MENGTSFIGDLSFVPSTVLENQEKPKARVVEPKDAPKVDAKGRRIVVEHKPAEQPKVEPKVEDSALPESLPTYQDPAELSMICEKMLKAAQEWSKEKDERPISLGEYRCLRNVVRDHKRGKGVSADEIKSANKVLAKYARKFGWASKAAERPKVTITAEQVSKLLDDREFSIRALASLLKVGVMDKDEKDLVLDWYESEPMLRGILNDHLEDLCIIINDG